MTRETWYVLEDGSVADPRHIVSDDKGALRHQDGRPVAMRGDIPMSRGVDVDAVRNMKPEAPKRAYKTRDLKPSSTEDESDQKIG